VLNPNNKIKVIFVTSQRGYDYAVKTIPESDLVNYIITGEEFVIYNAMLTLRKKYSIDIMSTIFKIICRRLIKKL